MGDEVNQALMDIAPKLKAVGRLGVGLDNIDLSACAKRGIAVLPATGANSNAVAEYVIAGLLMLFRQSYHAFTAMTAGQWPRGELTGHEIRGKKLGLIGFGGIAQQVAQKAKALGMTVSAYDPHLIANATLWNTTKVHREDSLDRLLQQSDAISLHIPLTAETRQLIDSRALSRMKDSAHSISARWGD